MKRLSIVLLGTVSRSEKDADRLFDNLHADRLQKQCTPDYLALEDHGTQSSRSALSGHDKRQLHPRKDRKPQHDPAIGKPWSNLHPVTPYWPWTHRRER